MILLIILLILITVSAFMIAMKGLIDSWKGETTISSRLFGICLVIGILATIFSLVSIANYRLEILKGVLG